MSPKRTPRPQCAVGPLSDAYANVSNQPIPDAFRRILHRRYDLTLPTDATIADGVGLALAACAISGGVQACREFREAIEGRAPQRIDPQTLMDREITIHVVEDEPAPKKN